ncbi:hypothetical protein [Paenibacillus xylaniclasticus]|uniref:hypothetical protein n=1 Tax=Paenibacillus xylaniclasticus TaxID=588083 RepID=UPI000FD8A500|nr:MULTISPECIES: hypothetical protein [Paenibacillus]GFN30806.1 hypothetical protein PCURB6_10660 [Paenibacillus curdlanolyticus]
MNEYLIIGSIVIVLLAIVYAVKKYNIANGKDIEHTVDKATDIVEDVLKLIDLTPSTESAIAHILDITDTTATYVGKIIDSPDKAKVVHEVLDEVFTKLEIVPTDNEKSLIKIVIDESIKWLEKSE